MLISDRDSTNPKVGWVRNYNTVLMVCFKYILHNIYYYFFYFFQIFIIYFLGFFQQIRCQPTRRANSVRYFNWTVHAGVVLRSHQPTRGHLLRRLLLRRSPSLAGDLKKRVRQAEDVALLALHQCACERWVLLAYLKRLRWLSKWLQNSCKIWRI
jgi:hypothetical protein